MTEKEVTEKEIDSRLEEIINTSDDKGFKNITHVVRLIALILFNVRKDFDALSKICEEYLEQIEEDSTSDTEKINDNAKSLFI